MIDGRIARGILLGLALGACQNTRSHSNPAPDVSAGASASAAPRPTGPWYLGFWKGSFEAKRHVAEVTAKTDRVAAWVEDEGIVGVGAGQMEIAINESGIATGTMRGSLGDLVVSGAVEQDSIRLRAVPRAAAANGFAGVGRLDRRGSSLQGRLRLSSGDSHLIREAQVRLERAGRRP